MEVTCMDEPHHCIVWENKLLAFTKFCLWSAGKFSQTLTTEQWICFYHECLILVEYYEGHSNFSLQLRFHIAELCIRVLMHAKAVNYLKEILCTKVKNSNVIKIKACLELGRTYCIANHEQEAVLYYKKGLKIAEEDDDREAIITLFLKLGETCLTLNKYHESILYFKKSMEIAKEVGDRKTEKNASFQLGKLYQAMNQHEDSIMYGQKSFQLAKEAEDKVGELEACKLLHNSHVMMGRYEEAISNLATCIKIFKENGEMLGEAKAELAQGNNYHKLKQIDNSIIHLRRCCELAKNIGEKPTEMEAALELGKVYYEMENYSDTIACAERAKEIAKEVDHQECEMQSSFLLENILQRMRANGEAIRYWEACIDFAKAKGDELTEMSACLAAGMACQSSKRYGDAISYGLKCLEISLRVGDQKVGETKAYSLLAKTYFDLNQNDNAVVYSKKCIEMAEKIDDKQSKVVGYLVLGEVHRNLKNNDDAIHFAQKALKIARAINDTLNEMNAYVILGCAYKSQKKYDEAIIYTRKSMEIAVGIKKQNKEMEACYVLGEVYLSKHDYGNAILFSEKCISIAHKRNLAGHFLVMKAHLNAAESNYSLSNHKQAISHSEECIGMAIKDGDKFYEMNAYVVLVNTYQSLGEFEKAETYNEKCIDVIKKTGNKYFEMNARLLSLCNSYGLNKYDDAIKYGNLCIEMAKLHGDKTIEMAGYLVLSATYKGLEKYEEAVEYSKKCIALARRSNDKIAEMKALLVLSEAHLFLGDLDLAISRSRDCIDFALKAGDKSIEMKAYYFLSDIYLRLRNYDDAFTWGRKCIELGKAISDKDGEARACLLLGRAYDVPNQRQDVIDVSERCLTIAKETGNKYWEMKARLNAGRAYHLLSQYEKALHLLYEGLNVAEELQDDITMEEFQFSISSISFSVGSPVEIISYGKDVFFSHFWRKIQADPKKKAAITSIERYNEYKIRKDYELALKYLDKAIDAEPDLAQNGFVQVGRAQMCVYLDQNNQALEILQKKLPVATQNENKVIEAERYFWLGKVHKKLGQVEEAEESLRESIRCFEFMFYHLGEFERFKISIIDRYVRCFKELSKVLIETEQFEQALFISDGCRARVLKDLLSPKLEIEQDKLSSKDVIHLLSGRNCAILFYSLSDDTELHTFLVDESGKVGLTKSVLDFKTHLKAMTEKVLKELDVRTAVNCAGKKSQVHTSPISSSQEGPNLPKEGFLLRFDIQKEPSENNDESSMANSLEILHHKLIYNVPGLDQKDEIVIIPDDFLHEVPFAALRNPDTGKYLSETKRIRFAPSIATLKLLQNCAMDRHHQSGALIIGDPLVGKVMMNGEEEKVSSLEGALQEAKDIALVLRMDPSLFLSGENATKAAVIEKLQQGVSIVHIAAHGNLEKATILLAPSPEIRATKIPDEEDYMLTMADVQQAQVRAQLVVLSCCYSGRGKIRAEGVVGMCRAFLASGARAVVASLWAIDDDATLVFMKQFYKYLKKGESASTSLHLTMKYMRQRPRYSDPKYWAAFFLMGDDVTVQFQDQRNI